MRYLDIHDEGFSDDPASIYWQENDKALPYAIVDDQLISSGTISWDKIIELLPDSEEDE